VLWSGAVRPIFDIAALWLHLAFAIRRKPDVVSSFAANIRLLWWAWILFAIQ